MPNPIVPWASQLNQSMLAAVTSNTFTGPQDLTTGTVAPLGVPLIIPKNTFPVGAKFKVKAHGTYSTTGTPTLVFGTYLGSTALCVNTAITTPSGAATLPWELETITTIRALGPVATGLAITKGWLDFGTALTAVTHTPIPETAIAAVAIDTTVDNKLSVQATFSASSASNIVVLHDFLVEAFNF